MDFETMAALYGLAGDTPLPHYFVDEMFAHGDLKTHYCAISVLKTLGTKRTDVAILKSILRVSGQ